MSGRQGGPHDVGTARTTSGPSASEGGTADEIASVDRAIAALEAQREVLGDAVMAVLGLSRSYEDDAHRAIRSALAMLADLDDLNADLVRRFGVTLHMRV